MPPAGGTVRARTIERLTRCHRVVYVGATALDPELRYVNDNPCTQFAAFTNNMQLRENWLMDYFEAHPDQTCGINGGLNNAQNAAQPPLYHRSGQEPAPGWVYVLVIGGAAGQPDEPAESTSRVGTQRSDDGDFPDIEEALALSVQDAAEESARAAAAAIAEEEAQVAAAIAESLKGLHGGASGPSSAGAGPSSADDPPAAAAAGDLGQCAICCDSMLPDEPTTLLHGEHRFHSSCIGPWVRRHRSCPLCRAPVNASVASQAAASGNNGSDREAVGTLDRAGYRVYRRSDGSFYFNEPNARGRGYHRQHLRAHRWTMFDGTEMRGNQPFHG